MKSVFKYSGILLVAGIFIALLLWISFKGAYNLEKKEQRKIATVQIYESEALPGVDSVGIEVGKQYTGFGIAQIKDTIFENILVDDSCQPCEVNFYYLSKSTMMNKIKTDSFDCHACSGINHYVLSNQSMSCKYSP